MSKWFRKGDLVVVIAGNEKGKQGKILGRSGERVVIEGVNLRKKHLKARSQTQSSQIVEIPCSVHASNVQFADAEGNPVKVKVRIQGGVKQLYYLSSKGEGVKEVVLRDVRKIGRG